MQPHERTVRRFSSRFSDEHRGGQLIIKMEKALYTHPECGKSLARVLPANCNRSRRLARSCSSCAGSRLLSYR